MVNGLIIAGPLFSGKTTTADALLKYLGHGEKASFAFPLKREVATACASNEEEYNQFLAEMYDPKKKEFWRIILQWWGTEFRRQRFHENYWVAQMDGLLANNPNTFKVIDDCRFANEREMLRKYDFGFAMLEANPDAKEQGIQNHESEALEKMGPPDLVVPWMPVLDRVRTIADFFNLTPIDKVRKFRTIPGLVIRKVSSV